MRMPVWNEQGRRPVPTAEPNAVRIDPERVTVSSAGAFAKVADAAVSLGEAIDHQRQKGEAVEAAKQYAQTSVDWSKKLDELKTAAPEGGAGLTDQMLAHADEDIKTRLESAPTSARLWLEVRLANLRSAMADQAMTYEAGARVAKQSRDLQDVVDLNANRVRADFHSLPEAIGIAEGAIAASSLTADGKAKSREMARSVITEAAIHGLTDANPAAALTTLKAGTYDRDLSPDRKDRLMVQAEQEIRRREAEARARAAEARANARAEVEPALRDEMTAYSRGDRVAAPVSDAMIRAAYSPDRAEALIRDRAGWRSYATDVATVAMLPPAEQDAMLAKYKPEGQDYTGKAERFDSLARAVAVDRKQRVDDPAAYVARHSTRLQQAFADAGTDPEKIRAAANLSLHLQGEIGIPERDRQLLPAAFAKATVQDLEAAAPETRADRIQAMAHSYGELWPRIFKELREAKLPDEYEVLASTSDDVARKRLAGAIGTGKDTLRQPLGADARAIDENVDSAMDVMRRSLVAAPDGASIAKRYTDAARLLAYDYARTMPAADAATRAAQEVVIGRFDWMPQPDGLVARAPRGQGGEAESYGAAVLDRLRPEDVADRGGNASLSVAQRQAILLDAARNGSWVNNEKDDGWIRLDTRGEPVRLKDGKRLEIRFSDISAPSAEAVTADPKVIEHRTGLSPKEVERFRAFDAQEQALQQRLEGSRRGRTQ